MWARARARVRKIEVHLSGGSTNQVEISYTVFVISYQCFSNLLLHTVFIFSIKNVHTLLKCIRYLAKHVNTEGVQSPDDLY